MYNESVLLFITVMPGKSSAYSYNTGSSVPSAICYCIESGSSDKGPVEVEAGQWLLYHSPGRQSLSHDVFPAHVGGTPWEAPRGMGQSSQNDYISIIIDQRHFRIEIIHCPAVLKIGPSKRSTRLILIRDYMYHHMGVTPRLQQGSGPVGYVVAFLVIELGTDSRAA